MTNLATFRHPQNSTLVENSLAVTWNSAGTESSSSFNEWQNTHFERIRNTCIPLSPLREQTRLRSPRSEILSRSLRYWSLAPELHLWKEEILKWTKMLRGLFQLNCLRSFIWSVGPHLEQNVLFEALVKHCSRKYIYGIFTFLHVCINACLHKTYPSPYI